MTQNNDLVKLAQIIKRLTYMDAVSIGATLADYANTTDGEVGPTDCFDWLLGWAESVLLGEVLVDTNPTDDWHVLTDNE